MENEINELNAEMKPEVVVTKVNGYMCVGLIVFGTVLHHLTKRVIIPGIQKLRLDRAMKKAGKVEFDNFDNVGEYLETEE